MKAPPGSLQGTVAASDAEDRAYYILPPGNYGGLPTTDEQRALLQAPSDAVIDLTKRPAGYWESDRPRLAEPMLLMLDRVAYFDRTGGEAGLGTLRGEKDVDPGEWFFKAHFFQDPVQPGSLGIEAMIQLLQFYMLETGMDAGVESARFETLSHAHPMTWKYRGQVVPANKLIASTLEITETGRDDAGPYAVGKASLWVDGKRIYEAEHLALAPRQRLHLRARAIGREQEILEIAVHVARLAALDIATCSVTGFRPGSISATVRAIGPSVGRSSFVICSMPRRSVFLASSP